MTLLILGLLLWTGGHFFKRALPDLRDRLGDPGKGVAAALILAGVVLMVIGYRAAPSLQVWTPPAFLTHVNNLLVLLAFYLFAVSGAKTWLATRMRHPQLTAVKTWAFAHLLVNGDLASIVLFAGLLAWAVAEVIVINRAQPEWTPPQRGPASKEITAVVAALIAVAVVGALHGWLGPWPFPG